ncbi:hypothetical protein N2152v2_001106 [Parachlorella kessleri]
MEELKQLLPSSLAGQRLWAALEPLAGTELPSLIAAVLVEKVHVNGIEANGQSARIPLDAAASVVPGLTFLTPRGKHDLGFFDDYFVVKTGKLDFRIPYTAVRNLAIIELPKDVKKRVFLYINIDPAAKVTNGKQPLTAVVVQTTADGQLDIPHPQIPEKRMQGPAAVVVCEAFGSMNLPPSTFCSPDGEAFRSAAGYPGCEAYVKASQGTLFPMAQGLVFLERPAVFIPRAAIRHVEFARAGGTSSTFDLYVHKRDGSTQEFSNIDRSEIGAFEDYVRRCKLAVGTGESSSDEEEQTPGEGPGAGGADGSGSELGQAGADSESGDPEDEDFDPDSGGSSSSDEDGEGGEAGGAGTPSAGRQRGGSGAASGSAGGARSSDAESEDESSADSEDDESDDDASVVSEEGFSKGQLQSMMQAEGPATKKQRR